MDKKASIIVGLSLICSSLLFGLFFYYARQPERTIRVVGYATHEFEADIVKWSIVLSTMVPQQNVSQGYQKIQSQLDSYHTILNSLDIKIDEKNIQPVNVRMQYGRDGQVTGKILSQRVFIISREIAKIEQLAINPNRFIEKGITFEYSKLDYFASNLPDIKKRLLAEATRNARERGEEIAGSTSDHITKLLKANAGVFQITEPYSTDIAGYGIHNTSSRKKNIKVTVAATFQVK